ncbi:MAG: MBL fold metallo-hydrolase [Lachnospiraceae bacterium]|nr:MBL fold metallo-hydrolase [Lachnospiraceae bacterium]
MTENITVNGQNSVRIVDGDKVIYIDPFQIKEASKDADYILVTHEHYDHFSLEDIEKVAGQDCILVVPETMQKKAASAEKLVKRIVPVKVGEAYDVDSLKIETVAMYNILKPFHPKSAGWVGYVVTANGERVYVAGDIDDIKEAKAVKCDVAVLPIGGFYTMDAKKAAEVVNHIRPKAAIPVHYGALVGKPEDGEAFAAMVDQGISVEFKIKF